MDVFGYVEELVFGQRDLVLGDSGLVVDFDFQVLLVGLGSFGEVGVLVYFGLEVFGLGFVEVVEGIAFGGEFWVSWSLKSCWLGYLKMHGRN